MNSSSSPLSPLVSVVVPIYKVERYLRQCVDSILNQTLQNLEVILVDDGSPDGCPDIVDEYAEKDPRVVAVHQPNGGYGKAVNHGITLARGKYIGIIESDDWIEPTMYENLYTCAKKYDVDLVKSLFWFYDSTKEEGKRDTLYHREGLIESLPNIPFNPIDYPIIFECQVSLWANLYRADFLKQIKLEETPSASYQDFPFMMEVYARVKNMYFISTPYVHYRMECGQGSSCTTNDARLLQAPVMHGKALDILEQYKILDKIKEHIFYHIYRSNYIFLSTIQMQYAQAYYDRYREVMLRALSYSDITYKQFNAHDKKHMTRLLKHKKVSKFSKRFKPISINKGYLKIIRKGQEYYYKLPWGKINPPLVSIIVPVYNSEFWLRACLDSVCNQSYKQLEIICVNDGSTDHSLDVLKEYQKQDARIIIINQPNQGLSVARNSALKILKGEWILAIDGDDILAKHAISDCLKCVDESVDIVVFQKQYFNDVTGKKIKVEKIPAIGKHPISQYLLEQTEVHFINKFWRTSFLRKNNAEFLPHVWYEDKALWFTVAPFANHVYYLKKGLYHYRIRKDSIMGKSASKSEKTLDQLIVTEYILNQWRKKKVRTLLGGNENEPIELEMHLMKRLARFATDFIPENHLEQVWLQIRAFINQYGIAKWFPSFPEVEMYYHHAPNHDYHLKPSFPSAENLALLHLYHKFRRKYRHCKIMAFFSFGKKKDQYKTQTIQYANVLHRIKSIKKELFTYYKSTFIQK